jgi:hypothetical protein
VLAFHDPIPDVRQQRCSALLVQEYWYQGELEDEANVLFVRLDDRWHRFFIDAGLVFWKSVESPDLPPSAADHSYRVNDVGSAYDLKGKRLAQIEAVDLDGGGAIRLAFEGGSLVILENRNDRSRLRIEHGPGVGPGGVT